MKTFIPILLIFFVISCSSNESTENEKNDSFDYENLSYKSLQTSIPSSATGDALLVKLLVEGLANSLAWTATVNSALASNTWQLNEGTYTYTYSAGGNSISYNYSSVGDTVFFNWAISGTLNGLSVSNFKLYDGKYSTDGKKGKWTLWDNSESNPRFNTFSYSWSTDLTGKATINIITDPTTNEKYNITINSNLSGTMEHWESDTLIEEATWDASGNVVYTDHRG